MNVDDVYEAPWNTSSWEGKMESVDGTPTSKIDKEDVQWVFANGNTSKDDWDGQTATIVLLNDGRFAGWESWWGPTGTGFIYDAYGGNAVVWFGRTLGAIASQFSEQSLELIRDQLEAHGWRR